VLLAVACYHDLAMERWIFGYGSLVWKPDFQHLRAAPGSIRGWTRRFWQASTDHRGTEILPGRVVTLIRDASAECWGVGYQVAGDVYDHILAKLDHREKGGYERVQTELFLRGGETVSALTYVAGPENDNYVGEEPIESIAALIRERVGPSGNNAEYVLRLAHALEELGVHDPHVALVAQLVRES